MSNNLLNLMLYDKTKLVTDTDSDYILNGMLNTITVTLMPNKDYINIIIQDSEDINEKCLEDHKMFQYNLLVDFYDSG